VNPPDPGAPILATMTRIRFLIGSVLAVVILALTGCGDDAPAVCESLTAVRQSVDDLSNVTSGENGLSTLSATVTQVKADLRALVADAGLQFEAEIGRLKAAVEQLSTSLTAARADPNVTTIGTVRTTLAAAVDAARSLVGAASGTC
jgi:hypothetical protein